MSQKLEVQNILRRSTPFACPFNFSCDIPEPPLDPKLIGRPVNPEKLAQFFVTQVERNPKRELVFESGSGLYSGLADTSSYMVNYKNENLHPEDLALLEDEDRLANNIKVDVVTRKSKSLNSELSWLMRTTYISNDGETSRNPIRTTKIDSEVQKTSANTDDEYFLAAEASFEASKLQPKHPDNPSMEAVEIIPVLPNFHRMVDNYVLIEFESEPTLDHPNISKHDYKQRHLLAERSIIKSYTWPGNDRKPFLAYTVPKNLGSKQLTTGEFEWIREYQYDFGSREAASNTFLLHFSKNQCQYLDLNTKMKCFKRSRNADGSEPKIVDFQRPSKILVKHKAALTTTSS